MNSHKNARLGFTGRVCLVERVLEDGWTRAAAARAFGVSDRTVRKWLARFRTTGRAGLEDRSSRPHQSPRRTRPARERRIAQHRDRRETGAQIARALHLPRSTVGDVLRRLGRGRLPPVVPRPPVVRYERERPGELLHIDAKKLGRIGVVGHRVTGDRTRRTRGLGWECLHNACTWPSTMRRASPTLSSWPMNPQRAPSASSSARSRGSRSWACASSA